MDLGEKLSGGAPVVFLKQFRDAARPDEAVHQSIVEALTPLEAFRGGQIFGDDYEITLPDYASQPIRIDLGLAPGPLKPKLSFLMKYDFKVGLGKEVWKAQ